MKDVVTTARQVYDRLFAKRNLKRDYIETFSSPHGARVLADILARAGVTRPIFNADPNLSKFYEGHRHLAFSIFRQVHGSIDKLPDLMAEEIRQMEEANKAED